MAVARFQIVSVSGRELAGSPDFAWRFLSANNRSMARSVPTYPDADACLAAIAELRERLPGGVCTTVRNGSGEWLWRIRAAELDIAVSSRRYQRRVRAKLACESFMGLVANAWSVDAVQIVRM